MATDFYVLLNLARDADLDQIRRAYRELLARRMADDVVELRAAYETLRNPGLRAAYDRELDRARPGDLMGVRPRPAIAPVHLFDSFQTHRPTTEHLSRLIAQNFTGRDVPKSRPRHPVHIDIILDPSQATAGGRLPLHIPVPEVCGRCAGTGRAGSAKCDACDGEGGVWRDAQVDVLIPPNTRDNIAVPVSLTHLGIRNLHLVLHLRVARGYA